MKDTCILVAFSAKKKDYSGRFGLYKGEAGDYPTMPVSLAWGLDCSSEQVPTEEVTQESGSRHG